MTDILDLTNLFSGFNLDIDSQINNYNIVNTVVNQEVETGTNTNMPNTTDYQLLKLYLDSIPCYDGNPHTLTIFLNNAANLINQFASQDNETLNTFLLRALLGKLKDRALILVGSRTELNSWDEIKSLLTNTFGDQRDLECLIQDLLVMKPIKGETPWSFGERCQDARSLINSKINSSDGMDAAEKLIRLKSYSDLALKTFIRGLPSGLQSMIRLRNPDSLEKAMGLVIEEQNFFYASGQNNFLNSTTYNPFPRITPTQQSQPSTSTHTDQPQRKNMPNAYNRLPRFPFQYSRMPIPINNNPRNAATPRMIPNFNNHYNFQRPMQQNFNSHLNVPTNNHFQKPTQQNFGANSPTQNSSNFRNKSFPSTPYSPTPMEISTNTRLYMQNVSGLPQDIDQNYVYPEYDYYYNTEDFNAHYDSDWFQSNYNPVDCHQFGLENNFQNLNLGLPQNNSDTSNTTDTTKQDEIKSDNSFFRDPASQPEKS